MTLPKPIEDRVADALAQAAKLCDDEADRLGALGKEQRAAGEEASMDRCFAKSRTAYFLAAKIRELAQAAHPASKDAG